jgi:uncharacterized sporulation protein YeaH/YhbH (DUF444 family)
MAEAEVVMKLVQTYYEKPVKQEGEEGKEGEEGEEQEKFEYDIITPYEGQRTLVADLMKKNGSKKQVYNVDSFQASPLLLTAFSRGISANITIIGKRGGLHHHYHRQNW